MIRLRTHSIRYETGLRVANTRNQSHFDQVRGMFIEEMKRKTKSSGNIPAASPEPVRSASPVPRAPNPSETTTENTMGLSRPSGGREVDAHGEPDRDVEDGLDEAVQDHAAELAGEQDGAAHRRQLQAVEEPDLHVARELGPCVHGREARPG